MPKVGISLCPGEFYTNFKSADGDVAEQKSIVTKALDEVNLHFKRHKPQEDELKSEYHKEIRESMDSIKKNFLQLVLADEEKTNAFLPVIYDYWLYSISTGCNDFADELMLALDDFDPCYITKFSQKELSAKLFSVKKLLASRSDPSDFSLSHVAQSFEKRLDAKLPFAESASPSHEEVCSVSPLIIVFIVLLKYCSLHLHDL